MAKETFFTQIIIITVSLLATINAGKLDGSVLPGNIIPIHYNVHLTFTHGNFHYHDEYAGSVEIYLKVIKENAESIILHSKDMNYEDIILHYPNGTKEQLKQGKYIKVNETKELIAKNSLPMNQVLKLYIKFKNLFSRWRYNEGIFRLRPKPEEERIRENFILTHGQPDHIRKVFPCFDEPSYKATFEVSVTIPDVVVDKGFVVLTNTEVEKEWHSNNMTTYKFAKTPIPISSYLFALSITHFNHSLLAAFSSSYSRTPTGVEMNDKKLLRTFGHKTFLQLENTRKIHAIAPGMLNAFAERFKVGYAFKKLDQVFIGDFPYFGMENIGLIFYDMDKFKEAEILELSYIEAHEIAHQWFGNLVTAKDWTDDFWIQEGFAHYFGTVILDEVYVNNKPPGYYDFATKFVIDNILPALKTDSYNQAPPVREAIKTLFGNSFAYFTLDKAATLIRMLKLSYGPDVFDKAMQIYFHTYKEKNANTTDLLNCFDQAFEISRPNSKIKKPSEIQFENWIDYEGYPLVEIGTSSDLPSKSNVYYLTQKRFIHRKIPRRPQPEVEYHEWVIPITYSTSENQNFNNTEAAFYMDPNSKEAINITLPRKVDWIILNNQLAGFYRVNYDTENWEALTKVLNDKNKFTQIHELNRAQLLDDSLTLATSNENYRLPLPSLDLTIRLYKYLEHENKYYPWKAAIDRFKQIEEDWCRRLTICPEFKNNFQVVITKKYHELKDKPSENVSYQDEKLKELIIDYYCKNINASCQMVPKKSIL